MSGVGQPFLPLPQFSPENPYWRDNRKFWDFIRPEYRPRLSAQDFLYACVWERNRPDPHMAYCVRTAWTRTKLLEFRLDVKNQFKKLQEKKHNEKAA